MHGVMMVFFFLIPSIPATLGNFLDTADDRRARPRLSPLNLLSWYLYIIGGTVCVRRHRRRRRRHGLDLLHALLLMYANTNVVLTIVGVFIAGFSSILTGHQLHRHHPQDARAGYDLVPHAAVRLGALRHQL